MKEQITLQLAKLTQAKEIHNLMQFVYHEITDKDIFVCDDLLYVEKHIQEQGFIVIAKKKQETIVGCLVVHIPGEQEDNLGFDIELNRDERTRVAHMDSAVVHPRYRGMGLQGKMIVFAEKILWEKWKDQKESPFYFLSTVSPENPASYRTLEKQGYIHVCTKEKYGGLERRIYCKQLFCIPQQSN